MNLWKDKLTFSQSKIDSDMAIIKSYFPRCLKVEVCDLVNDKHGSDYIATLGNTKIFIDAKTREKGASRFWKHGEPELVLEVFSVVEEKKIGWTFSGHSIADYILYTFDPADTDKIYMLPFQSLRKIAFEKIKEWSITYGKKVQESDTWHSMAVFVPASVVLLAINQSMIIS